MCMHIIAITEFQNIRRKNWKNLKERYPKIIIICEDFNTLLPITSRVTRPGIIMMIIWKIWKILPSTLNGLAFIEHYTLYTGDAYVFKLTWDIQQDRSYAETVGSLTTRKTIRNV